MTQINECGNWSYYAFKVFVGESKVSCCTIGAFGDNSFDALKNAITLFRPILNRLGDPDKFDYLHQSDWSKK
ncbi:hypothetical protein PP939_gp098 [Rhizobium phage RL38J1]|uniref:Uncharacterized protein n=1 Tax=Rhizobium phage RL38J1 TaxID=2663232 RepID=A0A6B9JD07_9CAUD|nr:hypothetical protein PP939_gp098 [Rhizobium phage RL38J1]QGZ14056.1 hypothetical protein RL38J1_098 [Rhizobium phage RL38J1]